jgi:tetratricopeptide (TPR) repeat protein
VSNRLAILLLALAVFQPARSQTNPSPETKLAQARDDLQHGKDAEAIAILEQLAAAKPDQRGLQHDLGLACYRTGKLREAREAFARAIAADPSDVESVQMEGLTLYRLGQPAAAIPYLERVRQWAPHSNADANYVLGLCYLNSQRFDDARSAFSAQYGLAPASAGAYLMLGQMLLAANLPEKAADAARKALDLSPELPLSHFLIGEVDLYKADLDGATREFEAERRLNPAYAPVYDRLGDVYTREGEYELAQQVLMKALSLDLSRTGPFLLMGKVLLHRNDPRTAVLYLKRAETMDPSNVMAHTLLGQAYRTLGQEAAAKEQFEAVAKIHAASDLKLEPVN